MTVNSRNNTFGWLKQYAAEGGLHANLEHRLRVNDSRNIWNSVQKWPLSKQKYHCEINCWNNT